MQACIASLRPLVAATGATTLVLLDDRGDDEIYSVALRCADRVERNRFVNFATQRNKALDLASSGWVFFIDVDERCTPALASEIGELLRASICAAYKVPRRNILFGREVRHTGWYPDYQVRLLEREKCRYDEGRGVHELPEVAGEVGTLREPLIHYNYATWRDFLRKQLAYSRLEARSLAQAGVRARPRSLLGQPLREFGRRFIEYRGYKDGFLGLALSLAMAFYRLDTYRRLLAIQRGPHRAG